MARHPQSNKMETNNSINITKKVRFLAFFGYTQIKERILS
jgi:hypothetical protein